MLNKYLITLVLVSLIRSAHTASLHDRRSNVDVEEVSIEKIIATRDSTNRVRANITPSNNLDPKFDLLSRFPQVNQAVGEVDSIDKLRTIRNLLKRDGLDPADIANLLNDIYLNGKVTPEGVAGAINVLGLAGLEGSVGLNGISGSIGAATPSAPKDAATPNAQIDAKAIAAMLSSTGILGDAAKPAPSDSTGKLGDQIEQGKSAPPSTSAATGISRIGALLIFLVTISSIRNGW